MFVRACVRCVEQQRCEGGSAGFTYPLFMARSAWPCDEDAMVGGCAGAALPGSQLAQCGFMHAFHAELHAVSLHLTGTFGTCDQVVIT